MANSEDANQAASLGAVWTESTLFVQACLYNYLRTALNT